MSNNKCKNCGGELVYEPKCGELQCVQCSTITDIPDQQSLNNKKEYTEQSQISSGKAELTQYHCPTCGRNHLSPYDQELDFCPSCGDVHLEKTAEIDHVPDGIIPFKLNQEAAMQSFSVWLKKQRWAPNNLKKIAKTKKLKGYYFPVFNYDVHCSSSYSGVAVTTHTDSEGRSHTTRRRFSGNRNDTFNNYTQSASLKVPSNFTNELANYNYNSLYTYRTEYLYGWTALDIDVSLHDSTNATKVNIYNIICNQIKRNQHCDRIENFVCNTIFNNISYNYLYVPVYINTYTYKEKEYSCYINGVTGKVSGSFPKSFWKRFFVGLLAFLFIAGLVAFIAFCETN